MNSGLKKTARVILFLVLGLLLLWISFRGIDLRKLGGALRQADYIWLLPAFVVSLLALIVRARRWSLLIEPLGYRPRQIVIYHSLVSGYFANLIFPRLGEVTRCAALAKKENMPFDRLVGTVIIERSVDLLTVLFLLALLLTVGSSSAGSFLTDNIIVPAEHKLKTLMGSTFIALSVFILLAATAVVLFIMLKKRLMHRPLFKRIYSFSEGIFDGLKSVSGLKRKWEFILLTVLLWVIYLLMAFFPLLCLKSTSDLGLSGALFILVIGSFGMAVPVQSGLGAFHWIVSRGLMVVYAIPLEQGLAYATLSHESQLVIIAVLGAISLFALFGTHIGKILSSPVNDKTD